MTALLLILLVTSPLDDLDLGDLKDSPLLKDWAPTSQPASQPKSRRPDNSYIRVSRGFFFQFPVNFDRGEVDVSRVTVQANIPIRGDRKHSIALRLLWNRDNYAFSGDQGFASLRPWGATNTLGLGAFLRYAPNEKTTFLAIPTFSLASEVGGDLRDGIQGGSIFAVSFKINDRLSLGPGIGAFSQIEDGAQVFPVLSIKWNLRDDLVLRTGSAVSTGAGPGLVLDWKPHEDWTFSLGGRFENRRFRLDGGNTAPDGVGEDESFPIYVAVQARISRRISVALSGGVSLSGRFGLEDKRGRDIASERYETGYFIGGLYEVRF